MGRRRGSNTIYRVRISCPRCGVVDVGADAITLRRCVDDDERSYRVVCDHCGSRMVRGLGPRAWDVLAEVPCAVEEWRRPLETVEHPGAGGELEAADEDRLRTLLEREDFVALMSSTS